MGCLLGERTLVWWAITKERTLVSVFEERSLVGACFDEKVAVVETALWCFLDDPEVGAVETAIRCQLNGSEVGCHWRE